MLRARGRVHVANALRDSPSPPPRAGSTLRTPAAARAAMLANAEVDAFYGTPRSAERRASPGHYALESPLATSATLPEIRAEPLRASKPSLSPPEVALVSPPSEVFRSDLKL